MKRIIRVIIVIILTLGILIFTRVIPPTFIGLVRGVAVDIPYLFDISTNSNVIKQNKKSSNRCIEIDFGIDNNWNPIKWWVLDKEYDKVLLISKNIVTELQYNDQYETITWEDSLIRKWLNLDFLQNSFNIFEQNLILSTNVINKGIDKYKTIDANDTIDKLFLLSEEEVIKYLDFQTLSPEIVNKEKSNWWLRTVGNVQNTYMCIKSDDNLFYNNVMKNNGVRPAMWVDKKVLKNVKIDDNKYYIERKYNMISFKSNGNVVYNVSGNPYGQEYIKNSKGEIIDWTNKIEGIAETHELQTRKSYLGTHPYYYANIGDSKNWEMGPKGYRVPPEEYRSRMFAIAFDGSGYTKEEIDRTIDNNFIVCYKINGFQITIKDFGKGGRTVYFGHKPDGSPNVALMSDKHDKASYDELVALVIANNHIIKSIKSGR